MRFRLSLALVLLLTSCSRGQDHAPATRVQLEPERARAYQSACATCHARAGTGAPLVGDDAQWRARRARGFAELFAHTVNGFRGMPPLGGCGACSEADLEALVAYVSGAAR
jgi:cytochrome c5